MKDELLQLVGQSVAIKSRRYESGIIVTLKKDRYGVYWDENWQKVRPEDEERLEVFTLTPNKQ